MARRDALTAKTPELLYQTSDPFEVPLVMPLWARQVPELGAKIDAGYELHRRGHLIAAERGIAVDCLSCAAGAEQPRP